MTRCSISLAVLLVALPAHAQPESPTTATEALRAAHEALAVGAPGRAFELARVARAYDPSRSLEAWTLMGRAQSELGDAAAAHRFFRSALAIAREPDRSQLLARMQLERDEFGIIDVDVQPGGATLFVDGQRAELERGDTMLLLRPGTREITARLLGHEARQTSVHVTAGSRQTVRFVLPQGADDRTGSVPTPSRRHPGERWLSGNLMMAGLGSLGAGVSGGASSGAHPSIADELHFELGVSLGLVFGSSLNILLSSALGDDGSDAFLIRFMAIPVLIAVALPSLLDVWGPNQRCQSDNEDCDIDPGAATSGAAAAGTFFGMAVSTFTNLGLSFREVPLASSFAATFLGLGLLETGLAIGSIGTANGLRADATQKESADAVAAVEAAAAHQAIGEVAGTMGLVFFGLSAASAVVGVLGDSDAFDLTVAAGPGTVSVSGTF